MHITTKAKPRRKSMRQITAQPAADDIWRQAVAFQQLLRCTAADGDRRFENWPSYAHHIAANNGSDKR